MDFSGTTGLDCCRRAGWCCVSRETFNRSSCAGESAGRKATHQVRLCFDPCPPRLQVIHKVIHSDIHRSFHACPRRHPPALASGMTVRSAPQDVLTLRRRNLGPHGTATRCGHLGSESVVLSPFHPGESHCAPGVECGHGRKYVGEPPSTLTSSECQGAKLHPETRKARRPGREDLGERRGCLRCTQ